MASCRKAAAFLSSLKLCHRSWLLQKSWGILEQERHHWGPPFGQSVRSWAAPLLSCPAHGLCHGGWWAIVPGRGSLHHANLSLSSSPPRTVLSLYA